jgi:hypothetical protein
VGIALALAVAVAAVLPWRVTAQDRSGSEGRTARIAEQWEDVLLLDATRYLRLSREQLAQFSPLARLAADRLNRLEEENERTLATVERIARKHREALLRGQRVSTVEQEGAVNYGRALQQKRAEAEEQLVQLLAPRLARVLTREQIQRAFLLALGDWPKEEAKSPALLDPASGFVVAPEQRSDWLTLLSTADPTHAAATSGVEAASRNSLLHWKINVNGGREIFGYDLRPIRGEVVDNGALDLFITEQSCNGCHQSGPKNNERLGNEPAACPVTLNPASGTSPARTAARMAARLAGAATEAERVISLRPLVGRLFFSPRLRPVLAERLGQ